jgi:hypothetical protein
MSKRLLKENLLSAEDTSMILLFVFASCFDCPRFCFINTTGKRLGREKRFEMTLIHFRIDNL